MIRALALLLSVGGVAAGTALVASDGRAQEATVGSVYESSIGGVVTAPDLPPELAQGYLVYSKWCSGCHSSEYRPADPAIDASQLPIVSRLPLGTNLLQQRYQGKVPADLEQRTDLAPETVRYFVRRGLNAMPPFRKTEITDAELDGLAAYLARKRQDRSNPRE